MEYYYFDNAATTKPDDRVVDKMVLYLRDEYGNAETLYDLGTSAADAIEEARQNVANSIRANPDQIIFTSGGAESNSMVFYGLQHYLESIGRRKIITTPIEHESVLNSVQKLCDDFGFKSDYIKINHDGAIDLDDFKSKLDYDAAHKNEIGLVSAMHTNNETGVVNPVEEIADLCHEHNILFHTDCVQALGCSNLDVNVLHCDFLSISAQKIHGPKGVGALYARDKSILEPVICGGNEQEFGLRGGTENVPGIVGFGEACRILNEDFEEDTEYVDSLRKEFIEKLQINLDRLGIGSIMHLNGSNGDKRSRVVNVRFDGVDGETLVMALNTMGICVSASSACTSREEKPSHVLTSMGISDDDARNSIRVSFSRMNTHEEIDTVTEAMASVVLKLLEVAKLEE